MESSARGEARTAPATILGRGPAHYKRLAGRAVSWARRTSISAAALTPSAARDAHEYVHGRPWETSRLELRANIAA
jgi:hypothetical protein